MTPLEILDVTSSAASALVGNLVVHYQVDTPTAADGFAYGRAIRTGRERFPAGIASMFVAYAEKAEMPDQAARDAMGRALKEARGAIVCGCTVVLVGGFLGAAMRAIGNTIVLGSRIGAPIKLFGDIPSGARFIIDHARRRGIELPSEAEILAAADELRAAIPAPSVRRPRLRP